MPLTNKINQPATSSAVSGQVLNAWFLVRLMDFLVEYRNPEGLQSML